MLFKSGILQLDVLKVSVYTHDRLASTTAVIASIDACRSCVCTLMLTGNLNS